MGFFNRKEKDNGKRSGLPCAGCGSLTEKDALAIAECFEEKLSVDSLYEHMFFMGFMTGISFVGAPKDAETYGISALSYAENALSHIKAIEIATIAESVIEHLGGE